MPASFRPSFLFSRVDNLEPVDLLDPTYRLFAHTESMRNATGPYLSARQLAGVRQSSAYPGSGIRHDPRKDDNRQIAMGAAKHAERLYRLWQKSRKLPRVPSVKRDSVLPDKAWEKNAPRQVKPGTKRLQHQKYNRRTRKLEHSEVEYDEYGRQRKRTDYTDHGYGDPRLGDRYHSNPHTHIYEYGLGKSHGQVHRFNK